MRIHLILISVLLSMTLSGRSPSKRIYYFNDYSIEQLIPFTKMERDVFKKNGYKKIMQYYSNNNNAKENYRTVYFLDEEGNITHLEYNLWKRGKAKTIHRTDYVYDEFGRLTEMKGGETWMSFNIEIEYDSLNRIVKYCSKYQYLRGKDKCMKTEFDFKLTKSDANSYTLTDSSDINSIKMIEYNSCNQLIRQKFNSRIDSVSHHNNDKEVITKYWYMEPADSVYHLGKEIVSFNQQIQSESYFYQTRDYRGIAYKKIYHYNKDNCLLRIENTNARRERKFFIYNKEGFISEIYNVSSSGENMNCSIYRYYTSKY